MWNVSLALLEVAGILGGFVAGGAALSRLFINVSAQRSLRAALAGLRLTDADVKKIARELQDFEGRKVELGKVLPEVEDSNLRAVLERVKRLGASQQSAILEALTQESNAARERYIADAAGSSVMSR